ncbi:MAG TPA: type VI secretion system protein TssA [Pyrinomonadaceae bacterium]|nr:type VI secretion system protein TssA [Pyrinomonadaceae bacterium]
MSTVVEAGSAPAAPEVVDVGGLLAPLEGPNPSGENTKGGTEYDEILREVRASRSAGVTRPGDDSGGERKVANWRGVEDAAAELLRARTKDLQLCAWLTEALTNNHGFAGARDGLALMTGLHERFWETVYPEIDLGDYEREEGEPLPEDALDARVLVLEAFDRWLALALRGVPLTRSGLGNYSYELFEYSRKFVIPEDLDSLDEQDRRYVETLKSEGKVTGEQWRQAKDTTPADFYKLNYALVNECVRAFAALKHAVGERYHNPPGFPQLDKAFDEISGLLRTILREKVPDFEQPGGAGGGADGGAATPAEAGAPAPGAPGHTQSRHEALRKLAEVAEFFRRTEPHSPVSYLVERAVKWGNMPLETWLREVVKNDDVLAYVRETLGLGAGPPAADGGDKSLDET